MLAYDGPWSPDLFPVALTAAVEQEVKDLQAARIALASVLGTFFGSDGGKKLEAAVRTTMKGVEDMKRAARGLEPGTGAEELDEPDEADAFVRVFRKMGVVGRG